MSSTCSGGLGAASTPRRTGSGGRTAWPWRSRRSASKRLIPPYRQADRRGDEAEHAVGLHEGFPLLAPDGPHGGGESGIVVREETELVQAQQAGIERLTAERGREALALRVPGALLDDVMDTGRVLAPICRAVGESEVGGDAGQTIASGPAHHAGRGVHARRAAQLPDPGIRLIAQLGGPLAQRFEAAKQDLVSPLHQPAIEKHVRRRQDRRAVYVVLDLP